MVVEVSIDKAEVAKARLLVKDSEFNHPRKQIIKAAKKVAPALARKIRARASVRTGVLKASIKPLVVEKQDYILLGVQLKFYWAFVNKRTRFVSRVIVRKKIIPMLEEAI